MKILERPLLAIPPPSSETYYVSQTNLSGIASIKQTSSMQIIESEISKLSGKKKKGEGGGAGGFPFFSLFPVSGM